MDRFKYAYDYAGNRTYRDIDSSIYATNDRDQAYTYDGLHRLATSQQGTLSGSTISGAPAKEEDWTLDALGNWATYLTKTAGTTDLNQGRTVNKVNEITGISASTGPTWATPAYDLAGNMTSIPKPAALTTSFTATYDAWNRMVSIADGMTTVATYQYDGLNRRVVKGIYSSGSPDHNEHAYFNEDWQIVEVRKETGGTEDPDPLEQYVWHPFYIDAPVLRDYDANVSGTQTRYYYAFDANFNATGLMDNAGAPVERYHYSPYGQVIFLNPSFTALSPNATTIGNSTTYTGRYYDAEAGLLHFRNRSYHAQLGLFPRRDSAGYVNGNSLYGAYFAQSLGLDPSGEVCKVVLECVHLGLPLVGPLHCGLRVELNGVTTHYHVGGGLGQGAECNIVHSPVYLGGGNYWDQETFAGLPDALCKCVAADAARIDGAHLPYTPIPGNSECKNKKPSCNSNYTTHCLLSHCGLRSGLDRSPPVGWNHRMKQCTQSHDEYYWEYVDIGTGAAGAVVRCRRCKCDKWESADDAWCSSRSRAEVAKNPGG